MVLRVVPVADRLCNSYQHLDHLLLIGWQHNRFAWVLAELGQYGDLPQIIWIVIGSFDC